MAKPCSYDLRQKVIKAIKFNGMKKIEASEHFNISRNTAACLRGKLPPQNCLINLWLQRYVETEDFKAKERKHKGCGNKITDWQKFRAFVQTHGDKTQVEMAQLWEGEISDRTISRGLQKIGFTRKKPRRAKLAS